jgi:hypothetical protein
LTAEYINELDKLFCTLVARQNSGAQLTRNEQVVVDVYGAIGHIEVDGIHQDGADDGDRVLESFRILGASEVANHLDSVRWACGREVDQNGHYLFTANEEAQLDEAESRVYALFYGLRVRLLEYARQPGIR